jgi:hypothetical protein
VNEKLIANIVFCESEYYFFISRLEEFSTDFIAGLTVGYLYKIPQRKFGSDRGFSNNKSMTLSPERAIIYQHRVKPCGDMYDTTT